MDEDFGISSDTVASDVMDGIKDGLNGISDVVRRHSHGLAQVSHRTRDSNDELIAGEVRGIATPDSISESADDRDEDLEYVIAEAGAIETMHFLDIDSVLTRPYLYKRS